MSNSFDEKKCTSCKEFMPIGSFCSDKSRGDGLSYKCRTCSCKLKIANYIKTKSATNETNNRWYANNKEKRYIAGKEWDAANPTQRRAIIRKWRTKRMVTDPLFALRQKLSGNVLRTFKLVNQKKPHSTIVMLGCSIEDFHIQLGPRPGKDYDLDHICPASQALTTEELVKLNHHSNFRWLHKTINQREQDMATPERVAKCQELLGRTWVHRQPGKRR